MNNYLDDAIEELKRADHLIFVSLKYTRTVDVLRSVIERLINACDFIINTLLEYLKKKRRIKEYPSQPLSKCEVLKKKIKDDVLTDYINFYLLLRKLSRVKKFTKRKEFRRHVTMTAFLDDNSVMEVNMDIVGEYFDKTKGFRLYVQNIVK